MRSLVVAGVALATASGAACSSGSDEELSRAAQVYVATIRDVVDLPAEPENPDLLPVVYVVAVGETAIAADVQAEVASELIDDAEVRFADERAEALDEDVEQAPVHDEGVLVAVGELESEGDPVALEIEVYRSVDDSSAVVLTFAERSSRWTITSSSVVTDGGP